MVETALTVFGAAVAYSLTVFFFGKKTKPEPETFNVRKFVRSVIIGLVMGVIALQFGLELSMANFNDLALSYGVVGFADQLTKAIFRNLEVDELFAFLKGVLDYGS